MAQCKYYTTLLVVFRLSTLYHLIVSNTAGMSQLKSVRIVTLVKSNSSVTRCGFLSLQYTQVCPLHLPLFLSIAAPFLTTFFVNPV